jgi:hypothetical protein
MRFVQTTEKYEDSSSAARGRSLYGTIGERQSSSKWKALFEAATKIDVPRMADERQMKDAEINLRREMAVTLLDLGFRAMATRLHPDRGGSRDAIMRQVDATTMRPVSRSIVMGTLGAVTWICLRFRANYLLCRAHPRWPVLCTVRDGDFASLDRCACFPAKRERGD